MVLVRVSVIVRLWLIESVLTLIGLLHVTMGRYDDSEASGADGNRCALSWSTWIDDVEYEKSWKQPVPTAMQEMKMKMTCEVVADI